MPGAHAPLAVEQRHAPTHAWIAPLPIYRHARTHANYCRRTSGSSSIRVIAFAHLMPTSSLLPSSSSSGSGLDRGKYGDAMLYATRDGDEENGCRSHEPLAPPTRGLDTKTKTLKHTHTRTHTMELWKCGRLESVDVTGNNNKKSLRSLDSADNETPKRGVRSVRRSRRDSVTEWVKYYAYVE